MTRLGKRTRTDVPIYIHSAIKDRLKLLLTQWQKDDRFITLHTIDRNDGKIHRLTLGELASLAVEWFCDIHSPIETTPASRTADYRERLCDRCREELEAVALPGEELLRISEKEIAQRKRQHHEHTWSQGLTLTQAIMGALRQSGPLGAHREAILKRIMKGGWKGSPDSFRTSLARLLERGKIERCGLAKYRLPWKEKEDSS